MNLSESIREWWNDLKSIHVVLMGSDTLTDRGIETFGQSLKVLKNLEFLQLNFAFSKLNGASLKNLLQGLPKGGKLFSCILGLNECSISDEGLTNIENSQVSVEKIVLNINNCPQLTDKGFENITKAITRIEGLKSLTIGMSSSQISPSSTSSLGEILARFTGLEHIELFIRDCLYIEKKAVQTEFETRNLSPIIID